MENTVAFVREENTLQKTRMSTSRFQTFRQPTRLRLWMLPKATSCGPREHCVVSTWVALPRNFTNRESGCLLLQMESPARMSTCKAPAPCFLMLTQKLQIIAHRYYRM